MPHKQLGLSHALTLHGGKRTRRPFGACAAELFDTSQRRTMAAPTGIDALPEEILVQASGGGQAPGGGCEPGCRVALLIDPQKPYTRSPDRKSVV